MELCMISEKMFNCVNSFLFNFEYLREKNLLINSFLNIIHDIICIKNICITNVHKDEYFVLNWKFEI